ncbi:ABC transporter substrate-binding protein [Enterovirga rhinocerotis]|uniref:Iron complex transport system substrate-binding protein n=1 Tax=Enterovirga rhinocerotis TaxID=1339210 RepID=A0A4R7C790_9HYPH|nr:ABC transporter substrate-binding protein [Enterovirga rhinocerotis]TDR94131.1 iron complex transport system substrate-binding protein [Enterovirga rhinocerotis]
MIPAIRPLGAVLFLLGGLSAAHADIRATDSVGRSVVLAQPAKRIVLSDALDLIAFSLIDPAPAERIAGWSRSRLDDATLALMQRHDSRLADIRPLGIIKPGAVPVELIIALKPDLVVLGTEFRASEPAIEQLRAARIPVAILGLAPTLRQLDGELGLVAFGRLIGREAEAEAFSTFFRERVSRIRDRVAARGDARRVPVLLEAHAGPGTCCTSPGRGEGIGDFVSLAGGDNIGAPVIPGMAGTLSTEYVIQRKPEVFIATGGAYMAARGGLVLGTGVGPAEARDSLARIASRPTLAGLPAVKAGRVHGIAHALTTSGLNIVAIEAVAQWIAPDLFADLDPDATLRLLGERFLGFQMTGTFTIDLKGKAPGR